jgi:lycopene beta-cyclase
MAGPHYDIVLAGGGVAGLSLAYHLAQSSLRNRSILIVDPDIGERDDRTLCYWADRPTPFDRVAQYSWNRLRCLTERREIVTDLGAYRYRMIRGIDFRAFVLEKIAALSGVNLVQGTVGQIQDGAAAAIVSVGAKSYTGSWVFDSRPRVPTPETHLHRYNLLHQQFSGWEVATAQPVFTPDIATLLDFRLPQARTMRFFYVLPFTPQRALVELVTCVPTLLRRDEHERALETYLSTTLGIADYTVERREGGSTVLTDRPFPRKLGHRVMAVGALGGQIKPTTGYAFARIQQDSAAIVRSLRHAGHPFDVPPPRWRFRLYDTAMLAIMAREGECIKPIFAELFRQNPGERIFRFLDERSSPWDDVRLAATLPPMVGWRTLVR